MIDETLQDQAALYALGMLEGEEAAAFQAALKGNVELQPMVDEIAESAASITHALPSTKAPPDVLPRLLAQIRAERLTAPTAPRVSETDASASWMPWALAASIAVAATIGFFSGARVNGVRSGEQIARLRSQNVQAEAERNRLTSIIDALKDERVAIGKRVDDLRQRDAISQVQIATLKVQATRLAKTYANMAAYVVWDANGQSGEMRFDKLPPAGPGKDYQMWVIDPRYDAPVSAGVFSADIGRETTASVKPSRPIALAKNFAVSIEQKGGAATPSDLIILMSD